MDAALFQNYRAVRDGAGFSCAIGVLIGLAVTSGAEAGAVSAAQLPEVRDTISGFSPFARRVI